MATRRQRYLSVLTTVVGAVLLAACGGGGESGFNVSRVISFGDSYSDVGAYTGATSLTATPGAAPYFGGRFTTNTFTEYAFAPAGATRPANTNTATIWVEWVATRLGVAITPHEVGFGPVSIKCPADPPPPAPPAPEIIKKSCTAYGQGGSRVTDPNGIGHPSGALTVPLVTQVANHLTRFTNFSANDIVFLFAGGNDMFVQAGAVAQGLAPATAIANMQTAGTELATLIKTQILANGATRVAIMTLGDAALTPEGLTLPQPSRDLLTQLVAAFNSALTTGLAGTPVRTIDSHAHFADVIAHPSAYGMTNVTSGACDPVKIAAVTGGLITDGSSLFCNASPGQPFNTMKTGASTSTWFFADGNHPTTGGHKLIADYVITNLKNFGWIPVNL